MNAFTEKFCTSPLDYGSLCNGEYSALLDTIVPKSIAKNEFFVKKGDPCVEIVFVNSGMMRHFFIEWGKEITNWIVIPGSFSVSLISFITGQPSVENIQAIEDTEFFSLPRASWLKLCQDFPAFKDLWRSNIEAHYFRTEQRMHNFISKTAEQRYEILNQKYPELIKQGPLKYIASMLGVEQQHLIHIQNAKKELVVKD